MNIFSDNSNILLGNDNVNLLLGLYLLQSTVNKKKDEGNIINNKNNLANRK
jgi:hypothetical protein